jgi:hypothetical protein
LAVVVSYFSPVYFQVGAITVPVHIMLTSEQEQTLHRARFRQERIAALRWRRLIAQHQSQIDFETMWADPGRRAAYDHQRRLFYRYRPELYEPIPKMIGRRALLAALGTLLVTPALAQSSSPLTQRAPPQRANPARGFGVSPPDAIGSRVDVRNFSTSARPFRGGADDTLAVQAAIDYAASIGGATVYLGPGPVSLRGTQGIDKPALAWTAPGIVLKGDGPGGTVITVNYKPTGDVISLGSAVTDLNAAEGGIRDLAIGLGTGQVHSGGAAVHSSNGQKHQFHNVHAFGGFYTHFRVTGGPNQYVVWLSRCLIDATTGTEYAITIGDTVGNYPQETIIEDLESGGNHTGRHCIGVFNSSGLNVSNADVIDYAENTLKIFPGAGQTVVNSFVHNLQCDTSGHDGALIGLAAHSSSVHNLRFSLSWFSSNGGAGLSLSGLAGNPIDGVHISNSTAGGNVQHGIWINSHCKNIDLDNVTAAGNSAAVNPFTGKPIDTSNTYSGIMVDDGNNIGVSVVGGRSGAVGAWNGAATQRYGYVFGANTDYCGLFGATASGPTGPARNATAALLNSSTGAHNQINPPLG